MFASTYFSISSAHPEYPDETRSLSLQRMTHETTPMMVIRVMMMKEEDAINRVSLKYKILL
jgi:hypothetical protein